MKMVIFSLLFIRESDLTKYLYDSFFSISRIVIMSRINFQIRSPQSKRYHFICRRNHDYQPRKLEENISMLFWCISSNVILMAHNKHVPHLFSPPHLFFLINILPVITSIFVIAEVFKTWNEACVNMYRSDNVAGVYIKMFHYQT